MEPKAKPSNIGSKKLFKNPILELLTRTHISITLVLFTVLPTLLLVYGFRNGHLNTWNAVILFFTGLLAFTLVEYVMHRFLFHIEPTTPGRAKFARIVHGAHHDFPKDQGQNLHASGTTNTISIILFRNILFDIRQLRIRISSRLLYWISPLQFYPLRRSCLPAA